MCYFASIMLISCHSETCRSEETFGFLQTVNTFYTFNCVFDVIKQVEKITGTQLVVLHYQPINIFFDHLTGFEGKLPDGITEYLGQNGFNRQIVGVIAKVFIGVVL